jgi:small subunit ribosomal protein S3
MGRKVHPVGFRIGGIRDWQARWFAEKNFAEFLQEDLKIRKAIQSGYREAGISQVQIDRQANIVSITIYTARPGVVIGRGGQRVDKMRQTLESLINKRVQLNIQEIHQPELDAYLVARTIADQMESRIAYRRAMKQAISRTIMAGARGIRVNCAGRLGGAEIARRQTMHEGQVPLHTLRADIDYGFAEARTTLGRIGVKVWIYKGDILPEREIVEEETAPPELATAPPMKPERATAEETVESPPESEKATAAETVEATPETEKEPAAAIIQPETEKAPAGEAAPVQHEAEKAPETVEAVPEATKAPAEAAKAQPVEEKKAIPEETKPAAEAEKTMPDETAEAGSEDEQKAKAARPAPKRRTKKATPGEDDTGKSPAGETGTEAEVSTTKIEEEEDASTQAGKIPQDSQEAS